MNVLTPVFAALVATLVLAAGETAAQSQYLEHTYKLDDPANSPPATLADVEWLAGSWVGEAFGGNVEEAWNPPSAGSMVGMFKVMKDGKVSLYELELIVEENDSLNFKVKHFGPDFHAWEEKEDYVSFPLVKIEENAIHFSGISFYRIDENRIEVYLVFKTADSIREEKLVYRRR
jgi:hypothetical protein